MLNEIKDIFEHTYIPLVLISILLYISGLWFDNKIAIATGLFLTLSSIFLPLKIIIKLHKANKSTKKLPEE
jgi:hypothetical protein